MANHSTGNVIYVDTTDSEFTYARSIVNVKYVGAANGTAIIKDLGSGLSVWERSGTNQVLDDVCIRCPQGIEVEVTNGTAVYVYLK